MIAAVLAVCTAIAPAAQGSIAYVFSFPDRVHRVMHVTATFSGVPSGPLQLRMSRSSPGRYALHEFAKNVYDVRATDAAGAALPIDHPNPHQWDVSGHSGEVRVAYRVYGDQVDGTYLAIDSTHAHINMPAAVMWARGLDDRPVSVRFESPAGSSWRVATQLLPTADALTFTAPNLQYLMDSPAEFSSFVMRTFTVPDQSRQPTFRVAVHHTGTDADVDSFTRDVEVIVRGMGSVFGEYPAFEGNTFTFIADYRPGNGDDGMEHRNSTVITSSEPIRTDRLNRLETVSHEMCHAWNGERIRSATLEPFNLDEANVSRELWLAEGFCNYYGALVMRRAGFWSTGDYTRNLGEVLTAVISGPGRQIRSAREMSALAPFVDGARPADPTGFRDRFISYYTWGDAIALALDLTLRVRSDGRLTLDDYMRALWDRFGKSAALRPGYVEMPYTLEGLRAALSDVSGDAAFAADFIARYVDGREVADYAALLARAGLLLRPVLPGRAHAGEFPLQATEGGVRIVDGVPLGSPAYVAGLDRGDTLVSIGGVRITGPGDFERAINSRHPGDEVSITYQRNGQEFTASMRLTQHPALTVTAVEDSGQRLGDAEQRFRDAWLSSRARNAF